MRHGCAFLVIAERMRGRSWRDSQPRLPCDVSCPERTTASDRLHFPRA